MSAAPLRHYFVGRDAYDATTRPDGSCARAGCAKPPSDPVHLTPGDQAAQDAAIQAATAGHTARDPDPATREAARKRHAARWTFGSARSPREAG